MENTKSNDYVSQLKPQSPEGSSWKKRILNWEFYIYQNYPMVRKRNKQNLKQKETKNLSLADQPIKYD